MDRQYIYELKIDNNPSYKIMDVGTLEIEDEIQNLDSGMTYRRKYNIGYYIVKSQNKDNTIILLKSYRDLGQCISCKLNLELTYISKYVSKLMCKTIFVSSDCEEHLHKAKKIKDTEYQSQNILDDYD